MPNLINGLGGTAGFGENFLDRNDDGSTSFIDITSVFESGLNFFGTIYNGFYINNNGNITFNQPLNTFTPFAINGDTGVPIIAPFFADVDTQAGAITPSPGGNSTGSNLVYWDLDTNTDTVTITWDDVGAYNNGTTPNAFQLQIQDLGGGDFDLKFIYEEIQWLSGSASDGVIARAGYSAADGSNFFELPQSGDAEQMLELETASNANETGGFVFSVKEGTPNQPPVDIELSQSTVDENSSNGTVIGNLTTTDADAGDTHTYSLIDDAGGRFAINGNQLVVANGGLLDFESSTSHSITVRTEDNQGLTFDKTLSITVNNLNETPTDIQLSNNNIDENSSNGTVIGNLTTTDPDADTHTYSLIDDAGGRFAINGNQLVVGNGSLLNFESSTSHSITINTQDAGGLNYQETFSITLNDVLQADLVVSDITAPVETVSGNQVEVAWTITNQGIDDATGTWNDYLYLSEDAQVGEDQFYGSFSFTGTIAAGESIVRKQIVTLPIDLEGDRYFIVETDANNQIVESGQEDNNITVDDQAVSVILFPFPNLQVESVTAPDTAFSSQETVVEWTVTNNGNGATSAPVWYDRVWLSLDQTFDDSDIYLGQVVNPSYLDVGESYSNNLTVTLPRGIDGNYYFLVQTDSSNQVSEFENENDNFGVSNPTDVELTPPPDLQVTSVNPPSQAFSGQPMSLSWTVTNEGTGRNLETSWFDEVYMSADEVIDENDYRLGTYFRSGELNAGESYTTTQNVSLPIGVDGDFFFLVRTDSSNNVYEQAFEENNTGSSNQTTVNLTPPPDLEVEFVDAPAQATASRNLAVNYRITNFGATETPNSFWRDAFYLSTDDQLDTSSDLFLGERSHFGLLNPGDYYENTANFTLSNDISGEYYVFVVSDNRDDVFELDNANNASFDAEAVTISSRPPDLVVSSTTVPATGEAGKAIQVDWTVSNQGTGDTVVTSWVDRIIASTDETIGNSDDIILSNFTRNALLDAGDSYNRSELVEIPFNLVGDYNLFVLTDVGNNVYEGTEDNNNSTANPITITRQAPDLQVSEVTANSATGLTGEELTVNWTVQNLGAGETNSNFWYDQIYLSTDENLDSNDIYLGNFRRTNVLAANEEYEASKTFTVPLDAIGDFYVIVRTDGGNQVLEASLEDNNNGVSAEQITFTANSNPDPNNFTGKPNPNQPPIDLPPEFSPDLVVNSVDAPTQGISSQSFEVSWTVENQRYSTGDSSWYDAVYLSRDQVFDRDSDIYLGSYFQSNLDGGDSYTTTASFDIPRGLSGFYYVFVATDAGNRIDEPDGELNNTAYDGNLTQVILPPPADLVAGTITIPENAVPGENATIEYTVENQSTETAIGSWNDSIYISADDQWDVNDELFKQIQVSGPLNSGESYSKTVTATLPGVVPGDYNVIVRSDIRNAIPESDESNNTGASDEQTAVDAELLELGTPDAGTLGQGQAVYYKIEAEAGETLLLNFDSNSINAANELYVRYGEMPSRSEFDFGFSEAFSPDQDIVIPNTLGGSYYVLAYGNNVPGDAAEYEISAEILDFSLLDIITEYGSNQGQVTMTLKGAEFTSETGATLIAADGTQRTASKVIWKDSTEVWATFDLRGLDPGEFDVKIQDNEKTSSLENVFTVTSGATGKLETQLITPTALRPGQTGIVTVEYANTGETDIVAPLMTLSADNAGLRLSEQTGAGNSSIQFLAINKEGPAGILSPGARGSFSFIINPTTTNGTINFSLSEAIENETIDWSGVKADIQPSEVSDEAWNVIWNNFITAVGDTAGSYQKELADNATYLSQLGESTGDVSKLMAFELRQASNQLLGSTLISTIDATAPSPGLKLELNRTYRSSIDGRFSQSDFGRGWIHQWDINAVTDSDGNVTIKDYDSIRFFNRQADGSYQNHASDGATLTQENGVYLLREGNGNVISFRSNGNLSYVEDLNGNRITADYTGNNLATLTHSNGNQFTFNYNDKGRISEVIDQAGASITYSYDSTGEYLLNVTDTEGTTSYTYETSQGIASEHALRSVTFADGTNTFFDYDDQGRLIERSKDDGAEAVTYTYDSAGGITISDSNEATTRLLVNEDSATARIVDPLGRVTQFQQDSNGNLAKLISPDKTISTFTYDNQGNLLSTSDALGHKVNFTYDSSSELQSFQDQVGNTTTYNHNIQGSLESITYTDGSSETYSYDSSGNVTIAVNRRNQTIEYTYDDQGQLIRKDYTDGTSATFTYDDRGNLLAAVDADSTVTYTYDNADRLTKVIYGADRFLEFTYDSGGRRTQMLDQDGSTVNYAYDSVGRLQSLTDGVGENIVTYSYDSLGRLSREHNGNGTYTTYSYDDAGQVLSIVNYESENSINSRFDYTYDAAGRRTSMTTLEGTFTYRYDSVGQLSSVTLPSGRQVEYRYDAAGNRITVTDDDAQISYTTNNLNQYLSAGSATYTYDLDGNLITKTEGDSTWTYGYDSENRLVSVTTPEGTWSYEYDALGNRIASIQDGQRTEYLIDPLGSGSVVGEYNDTDGLVARYVHGLGLVGRIDAVNSATYYDADAIGSITGLTGADGDYLNQYSYLPFGEDLIKIETVSNPFEFVGQWGVMDEGNGLDFMRARYYNPDTGRFVSDDPIGLMGGDTNIRRYAHNDPINENDPLGLGYFAKRPLAGGKAPWLGIFSNNSGSTANNYNFEISHEHYFFDDGTNIGFGPEGRFSDINPDTLSTYRRTSEYYDDEIIREAMKNVQDKDYWVIPFGPNSDNCQEWAERVREEYERIKKEREREKKETNIIRPSDPNDILGPEGFGDEKWVTSTETLPYTIRFENQETATAPAQEVVITHPLDPDLDWRTFRLGNFGWGDLVFEVPENRSFYQQRLDLTEDYGFFVDVFATIDIVEGEATWTITTIDPETGEAPQDALSGFLPPNNEDGVGDGFVTYTIRAERNAETGDVIDAEARIIFDTEEPIDTPPIFNTLDAGVPTSTVAELPELIEDENGEFTINWSGNDDDQGSGIASYTVYVSENGGDFNPWLEDTILTEATYTGESGATYSFYVIAKDNAGNIQEIPTEAQATTKIAGGTANIGDFVWFDTNGNGIQDTEEPGLEQVTINLYDTGETLVSTTTTNINGFYSFTEIDPGDYFLEFIAPTDYLFIPENQGDDDTTDSDVNQTTGKTPTFTVEGGEDYSNWDAGLYHANEIADQTPTEDTTFTFSFPENTFNDVDARDSLTYSATLEDDSPLPSWLSFDSDTRTFSGTPTNENIGNLNIKVTATDSEGATVSDTFTLTVENTNDAPTVANEIADTTTNEDSNFSFTIPENTFSDIDAGDELTYSATLEDDSPLPSWLSFDSDTRTFSGTPANENVGNLNIKVIVTDSEGATVSDTFTLTVENTNDAPTVANEIANQTATEDTALSFSFPENTFNDVDAGDSLTYSASLEDDSPLPSWLSFDSDTRTFSGTPANENVGNLNIKVTATDSQGGTVSDTFTLSVENTNDAPTVANEIADTTTNEDEVFSFTIPENTFNDVDALDELTYSTTLEDGSELPDWLTFNQETRTFSGIPTNDNIGNLNVKVTATDFAGANATDTFTLEIENVNDAPTLESAIANLTATEDEAFNFTIPENTFNDVDTGDELTYSVTLDLGSELPTWLTFNQETRTFSGTPTNDNVGNLNIKVTVTDKAGANATDTFTLEVENVNDAPTVANQISDTTTNEDEVFSFTIPENTFNDVDALDELTYSATLEDDSPLPDWLSFNQETRTISGTPTNDNVGDLNVKVTVTDKTGTTASDIFRLTVENTNDTPTLESAIANLTATEDEAFNFTIPDNTFNDVDAGDSLTYSATLEDDSPLPDWLSFDASTLIFSGTPANENVGNLNIKVTATDSQGATVSDTFTLTVENTNDTPTLESAIANQSATEDEAFNFIIPENTFNDVDTGDELTYSVSLDSDSELPTWLTFNQDTRTFSGTPTNDNVGNLNIKVTVTDKAGANVTDTFTLEVENVNDAPTVANEIADTTTNEDSNFSFTIPENTFNDVDTGDELTYSATLEDDSPLPDWLSFNQETRTISGTPTNDNVGDLNVKVTVTDKTGTTASDIFRLTVENTNDAPTLENAIANQTATEDSDFSFTIPDNTFNDVDRGDELTYSATLEDDSELPEWLTFSPETRTFSGTPINENVGTLNIKVVATDKAGTRANDTFTLEVENINDTPTLESAIANQTATEDEALNFTIPDNTFNDVDALDELTYSATLEDDSPIPSWLSFDSDTRTFSGTPTNENVGNLNIKVTATDSQGATVSDTFILTIENTNDAPTVANQIADTTTKEDEVFSFTIPDNTFNDVDALDELTYSAALEDNSPLPSWLSFDSDTRTFGGTPANENVGNLDIKVTATDSQGATVSDTFTLTVENTNDAPNLDNKTFSILENSPNTTSVGTITASDPDTSDTLTYAITAGNSDPDNDGNAAFAINNTTGEITVADSGDLDFEITPQFNLTVTVTDAEGLSDDAAIAINLTDVNENTAPIITSNSTFSVAENTTTVGIITAEDADGNDLTFNLVGGADQQLFTINNSGELSFNNAPDFENASDSDGDNNYQVQVSVSDGTETVTQDLTISVTDENEAATDITLSNSSVAENDTAAIIGNLTVTDVDSTNFTYIVNDNRFEVVNSQLKLKDGESLDFETENSINLEITATDDGNPNQSFTKSLTIAVTNVNEAPTKITLSNSSVAENDIAAVIGNLTVTDVDSTNFTYTLNDNRFEVVNSQLKLKDGESLDFETENSINLEITATDDGNPNQSFIKNFAITVTNVNETPTADDATFTVDENSTSGTEVGITTATDPENETLNFAIANGNIDPDNDSNLAFAIDSSTGTITVNDKDDLDFEVIPTFNLEVLATDPGNLSDTAQVTINLNDLTSATFDVSESENGFFNLSGDSRNLKFALNNIGSSNANEVGVFVVDDENGTIDGIAPNEEGYLQAALEKAQVIFSTISELPNGFELEDVEQVLEFDSDVRLGFYLIPDGTTQTALAQLESTGATDLPVFFSNSSSLQVSELSENGFNLNWSDVAGGSDFTALELSVGLTDDTPAPFTELQRETQLELLDLRDVTGSIDVQVDVHREAAFDNLIGFYQVVDSDGGIDTTGDGEADVFVGDAGYKQAALENRITSLDLLGTDDGTSTTINGSFDGGGIIASFMIVDGTIEEALNDTKETYFSYLGANSGVDRIRLLGENTFGYEDLTDNDFDDVIVEIKFPTV